MTRPKPLRFLLCDDHPLLVEGLAALIGREPGWQVVAQAAEGPEAVHLAAKLRPDLAIVDVAMPGMNGFETAAAIRAASPETRIVALSMYADDHYLRRMRAAGARAYVLKSEAGTGLIEVIRQVLAGEDFIGPDLTTPEEGAGERSLHLDLAALTERERAVLRLLAQGRRTREIAADLGISAKTVETYRSRIASKLGIENLAGLVRFAIRAGLVPAE